MADDDDLSPRPFRRERNLSNRNFNRYSTHRHFSTESRSSVDSVSTSTPTTSQTESSSKSISTTTDTNSSDSVVFSSGSSAIKNFSYAPNIAEELNIKQKSLKKMVKLPTLQIPKINRTTLVSPQTPDPALLDVRQKVKRFETLQTGKFRYAQSPTRVLPTPTCTTSINEEPSEDEVDDLSDYVADEPESLETSYVIPEEAQEPLENYTNSPTSLGPTSDNVPELTLKDFSCVEVIQRSKSHREGASDAKTKVTSTKPTPPSRSSLIASQNGAKDFVRNYRTTPRPKTEVLAAKNKKLIGKFHSVFEYNDNQQEEEEEKNANECELRARTRKVVHPILEELINTEESYVENLTIGIKNYGNIFERKDLPIGLRGKKYVLLGNVEQIVEFHRDEFLPMLKRNQNDLKRLFDEFQDFIEQNCMYGYVIYTMNKQRSLKLCDVYKNYFKLIQNELDDKLGINSFLVQPIQRMARYPLLLDQFITTFFKNRSIVDKELLSSCCRLEKRVRTLLVTTNESEVINDIVDCNEFNVFYQGKFRKVSDFNVYDHTLRRSYRAKVFIFDKCIIYTEIKGKNLIFHGRYPCEHVGIVTKPKTFTLFYEKRKQQECDFSGDAALIDLWLELISDMINSFVTEERAKLHGRYSRESDTILRKPPNLELFRDSNRFSADSGIGNIWVMPKPEVDETTSLPTNRTTWYAVS